ncbi:hypothetical protein ETU09_02790 [Apibacter muscae]|uniref:Uncharacterized protein n=1 Tax=Apibacter muscae TaxID=2509004 RepID=A0A563DIA3_9FLAO|nr:hypothetical protein [Apibacter muscae]TWP29925.1 hypothetical protein ETU09_02790 [Apibacter muscae]
MSVLNGKLIDYLTLNKGDIIDDDLDWLNNEEQEYSQLLGEMNIEDIYKLFIELNKKDVIRFRRLIDILGDTYEETKLPNTTITCAISSTFNKNFKEVILNFKEKILKVNFINEDKEYRF